MKEMFNRRNQERIRLLEEEFNSSNKGRVQIQSI
jgi:hypothetical protein